MRTVHFEHPMICFWMSRVSRIVRFLSFIFGAANNAIASAAPIIATHG